MFKKNTAVTGFGIGNFISTTDGSTVTTGVPTCKRTLDGTAGACANAAAYDATGLLWKIDLAAGDMNGDIVALSFSLTGCIPISYTIRTTTKLVSDLNDIAATAIVSNGAITTLTGAVVNVGTVATLTGYTAPLDAVGTRGAIGLAAANLDTQLAAIPTDIDVQADAAAALTAYGAAAAGDAMALTVAERNSVAAATLDLANAIETNLTLREALRLIASATAGTLSGAATATITITNARANNKNRIVATVDANGNRTAITYDVS